MLRPRIIPSLLISGGRLVKTTNFASPTYIGDPINAVRIFNEKGVDELIVADIDATASAKGPDLSLVATLARECRMPLCYAGGVKSVLEIEKLIALGVEKVAVSSLAIERPDIVALAAERVGKQSIVVCLDIKKRKNDGCYEIYTHNGKKNTNLDAINFARNIASQGCGEILINSIDRDGTGSGYDFDLIDGIRSAVSVPISVQGGAGSLKDIESLVRRYKIVGAVAGSLFVFKGKFKAVLINYPTPSEKEFIASLVK